MGRHRPARGHQGDVVASAQGQLVREALADGQPLPVSKPSSVPERMLWLTEGSPRRSFSVSPRTQHAGGAELRGCQRLPFHQRHRQAHAVELGDALGHLLEVGQGAFQRLHQHMAVEPEDLAQQLLAKAIHHRHDDDEGGHPQGDAQEGKPGDDRDEAFLAPRPEVAQRQHPLEWGERPRSGGFLVCDPGRRARAHAFSLSRMSLGAISSRLAAAAALQFHLAVGQPLRTDQNLPRHADQVGRGELGAGPFLGVRHRARRSRRRSTARKAPRKRPSVALVTDLQVQDATWKGATASGQMIPASSWEASIMAATRRDGPMP